MKIVSKVVLFWILGVLPVFAADEASLGANLAGLLEYARSHNAEVAATRFEAEAALQRVEPAAALPDPVLRTELMDVSRGVLPSQVGSTRYTLMQSVPWFGKRNLLREAAEAQSVEANGQVSLTLAELSAKIKGAYAMYYYLSGSMRLTGQTAQLLSDLEQAALARYANGVGAQQDVLRAQVEKSVLSGELLSLQAEQHHVHGRLNALLARPATAALAEPVELRRIPTPEQLNYPILEAKLLAGNPQLVTAEARHNGALKNRELVYLNRYPAFTLGIAPNQVGNTLKSWDLMAEVNIPLQLESRRSREREAEAGVSAAVARKQSLQDQLLGDLSESHSALETAQQLDALTETRLIPQAELNYRAALAAYENGKADFAVLLEAQRQILKARQQRLKAQYDIQVRLAEIERLLGVEL